MKKHLLLLLPMLVLAASAVAEYRYIDESGNIHFVDHEKDVPARYRSQLYPTPTPMTPKEWQKMQREKEKAQKKKEREKAQEARRLQREQERQAREEERLQREGDKAKKSRKGLAGAFQQEAPSASPSVQPLAPAESEQAAAPIAPVAPPATPAVQ